MFEPLVAVTDARPSAARSPASTLWVPLAMVIAGCLSSTGVASAAAADPVLLGPTPAEPIVDVPYGPDPRQTLDIYPVDGDPRAPTVLVMYGGGWIHGDKSGIADVAESLSAEGFAVFNMNYRLATDTISGIPMQTDDVALAVRWVTQRGAQYGADVSHLGLLGSSSGAQVVMLASQLINATAPGTVRSVVEMSGVMDFYTMVHPDGPDSINEDIGDGMPAYLGCALELCTDQQLVGPSPLYNIGPTDPAVLLVNSDEERTPVNQATTMHDALLSAGAASTLLVVPGSKHGFVLYNGQKRHIWEFLRTAGVPIEEDPIPPTVTRVVPAASAIAVPPAKNVTATFSEPVDGVDATTFVLRNPAGLAVPAVVTHNATTLVATLNPAANLAADTRFTVTLSGGTSAIRDGNGNPLVTATWGFLTGPAPRVVAVSPSSGALGVRRTAVVAVGFTEAVDGVSATSFTLSTASTGSVTATVVRNGITNQWILDPNELLAETTRYTVTLTGGPAAIRDLAGNPLATTTWSFTTGG